MQSKKFVALKFRKLVALFAYLTAMSTTRVQYLICIDPVCEEKAAEEEDGQCDVRHQVQHCELPGSPFVIKKLNDHPSNHAERQSQLKEVLLENPDDPRADKSYKTAASTYDASFTSSPYT